MKFASLVRVSLISAAIVFPAAAHAQYPMMVFGGGYARECYDSLRDRYAKLPATLEQCNIALSQEKLSQKNRAATLNNRGIVFMRMKDHERATKDYEAALRILPNLPETKINLGAMLYHLGRYADAVASLDEGVKAEDINARATAYYNRGLANEMLGRFDSAFADYTLALKLQPGLEAAGRQLRRFRVVNLAAS